MKTANKIKTAISLAFVSLTFLSCGDMMDIDSDRVAFEKDHRIDNANDSIYSVMGILSKIQAVADRCIIMGELRGDLMTVDAANAITDLQEIENFEVNSTNQYADKRDFYDIINNCNYVIAHMDTTITEGQTKVMRAEYAQIKTLRAWTYWQMALIFGKVNYFTTPLLDADTAQSDMKTVSIDELAGLLISDIEPYAAERALDYGSVDGWNSAEFFVPVKMLLGDLYLYNNDYEKAAQCYYQLIDERNVTVNASYASTYTTDTRTDATLGNNNAYRDEVLSRLVFDSDLRSRHSRMRHLTYSETPSLLPASWFVADMNLRTHFHTTTGQGISRYFDGDLRGCTELSNGKKKPAAYGPVSVENAAERTLITKYYNNLSGSESDELVNRPLTSLALYRPSTLYLRYAEAINRLGKPTIAFAVLKYGLNSTTLGDTLKVDSNEVKQLPSYISFKANKYASNVGTAARGCGQGIQFDTRLYVIPQCADKKDSIEYVEECILQEMAAETCFEGNRFFDLLRMSRHRDNHPAFMAEKVARKSSVGDALRRKLYDLVNWWVK